MAEDTQLTPLNFNSTLIGKAFIDKKHGVEIIMGYISGLPPDFADFAYLQSGVGLALMNRGIGQHELDMACQKLAGECLGEDFALLITKSDLPFDNRWYLIGDLSAMLATAQKDRISLPFSDFLYDELGQHLDRYKRK